MLKQRQERRSDSTEDVSASRQSGFTIIEVLIVLAIAGLIMVVVLLAVPALQRSQRNNSRKTDARSTLSSLNEFISNNGGRLPSAACSDAGTGGGQCSFLLNYKTGYFATANISYVPSGGTLPTSVGTDKLILLGGATCTSATATPTAGQQHQIAAYYYTEGSTSSQCVSE